MATNTLERANPRRQRLLGENPGAIAQARYVRVTPMKARRVVDLIRGLPATQAVTVLKFAPQRASDPVGKVLASAVANAQNNDGLDPESLIVAQAFVDEGPTMKRIQPRAQGRAYRIRKRTSHITIVVEAVTPDRPKRKPAKKNAKADVEQPAKKAAKKADKADDAPKAADTAKAVDSAKAEKPAKKTTAKKAPAKKAAAKKTENTEGGAE